ncbi:MAG: DUF1822 family protein [Nostoc sp.]|uniref:DUF1822 family protein n=1 Tax=Nostoc sp. TaxID=1180 RepID=UPI002FF7A688
MVCLPINSTDFRLLQPEIIELELEHFQQATEISTKATSEALSWKTYLNALALLSFKEWLSKRILDQRIHQNVNAIDIVGHLCVGEFKICIIATENLLDEVVDISQYAIEQQQATADFYVLFEVLEEQEQAIFRGFLDYKQLMNYVQRFDLQVSTHSCYQLPFSLFDPEPNHLLFYCRFLQPSATYFPVASAPTNTSLLSQRYLKKTRTQLSQCLQELSGSINDVKLQLWVIWLFYALLIDLRDKVADELSLLVDRIYFEMVYWGLYHFNLAYDKSKVTDPVKYFAPPENQDLSVFKILRKPVPKMDLSPFLYPR